MVDKIESVHGSSGSNGCDYKLPLDESESGGTELRIAFGCVTSAAAKIVLYAKDGERWTAALQGSDAGFGHGFYMAKIGLHAIINDVKAFDGQGRVVGEMKPDQMAERLMASPPPR